MPGFPHHLELVAVWALTAVGGLAQDVGVAAGVYPKSVLAHCCSVRFGEKDAGCFCICAGVLVLVLVLVLDLTGGSGGGGDGVGAGERPKRKGSAGGGLVGSCHQRILR